MKHMVWIIVIAFLGGLTVFSVMKYIAAQKESYSLSYDLDRTKGNVGRLEAQKQNLLQTIEKQKKEQAAMNSDLAVSKDKIAKMETNFTQAQKTIEGLSSQFNLLKEENVALKNQGDTLRSELTQVYQQKDALQAKLSSLAELKKAIRELKAEASMAGPETRKKLLAQMDIEGNRGFLIKDGQTTHPAKVRIEVNPAPLAK